MIVKNGKKLSAKLLAKMQLEEVLKVKTLMASISEEDRLYFEGAEINMVRWHLVKYLNEIKRVLND